MIFCGKFTKSNETKLKWPIHKTNIKMKRISIKSLFFFLIFITNQYKKIMTLDRLYIQKHSIKQAHDNVYLYL